MRNQSPIAVNRRAVSLIEVVAAIMLSALLAISTLSVLARPNESAGEEACQAERIVLQQELDRFQHDYGRLPRGSFDELVDEGYWNRVSVRRSGEDDRPRCPQTRLPYQVRSGAVWCPVHGNENR